MFKIFHPLSILFRSRRPERGIHSDYLPPVVADGGSHRLLGFRFQRPAGPASDNRATQPIVFPMRSFWAGFKFEIEHRHAGSAAQTSQLTVPAV
jgi:hypothetical protein